MVYYAGWWTRCRGISSGNGLQRGGRRNGIEVEVKDLAFVIEGLHGEKFHRVDLVFLCEYRGKIENAILQSDTNQVGYDWLDIKTLNTAPLYPSKLRRQIMNLYEEKEYKK